MSSPRELPSAALEAIDPAELAPPGPVLDPMPGPIPREQPHSHHENGKPQGKKEGEKIPSFQDLTDDSGSEAGSEDWESWVKAAEEQFSEQQITTMHEFLRERGLFAFLKRYLDDEGLSVGSVLLAMGVMVRPETPLGDQVRMLKIACSRILRNRDKLEAFNTPQDAVALIRRSRKILILTGAGVSTSCGIPDFRSPTGLYARLKQENWDLDDPQDMFDLAYFKEKPNVFYSFAKEIYPSNFVPSTCHRFVRLLEKNDKLLRNYTQNIDGLFEQVGVEKMLNCHGSFATASCLLCRRRFPGSAIEADVFASRVPLCPYCTKEQEQKEKEREAAAGASSSNGREGEPPKKKKKKKQHEWEDDSQDEEEDRRMEMGEWEGKALLKPDIVFFGEALSDEFDRSLLEDREEVDLLIVIGTSLRVSPVAQLPSHLPHSIPQILINRDPVPHHQFDVSLLGDGDTIVRWLCDELAKSLSVDEGQPNNVDGEEDGRWKLDSRVPVQLPHHIHPPPQASTSTHTLPSESTPSVPPLPIPSLPAAPPGASPPFQPEQVADSHIWLFPGSDRQGKWVRMVREAYEEDLASAALGGIEGGGGGEGVNEEEEDEVELPASLAPGVVEGEGSYGSVSGGSGSESGGEIEQ
ncbi:hypothetical protein JCM11641_002576 [Rhodosporidiobolus odoratus]